MRDYVYVARPDDCCGCGECEGKCSVNAISVNREKQEVYIDIDKCVACGECLSICPCGCLEITSD